MPNKELIALLAKMDGGTGDPKEDAKIMRKLRRITNVPDDQLQAFMKTRDRHAIDGLRRLTQDLPRPKTHAALDKGGPLGPEAPMIPDGVTLTRAATAPTGSLFMTTRGANDPQERLRDMCSMTSAYTQHFCGGGAPKSFHDSLYATLKDDFSKSDSFGEWSRGAESDQMQAMADTCRSMSFFGQKGGHSTTYGTDFTQFADTTNSRIKLPDRAVTDSKVPLGSMGQTVMSQEKAFAARQALHATCIAEARKRERDIHNGTALRPENKMETTSSFGHLIVVPPAQDVGVEQGAPAKPRDWKAIAKTSWIKDVHSNVQTTRHAHSRIRQGESANKDLQRYHLLGKTCAAKAGKYGKIESKKDPVFDVVNPKDSLGRHICRFTYAKHSGYVP